MSAQLTIFYDGQCPLCVREMKHLKRLDDTGTIAFEDILADDFEARYPQVSIADANRVLHALNAEGEMLYGLDVTHAAWSLVGRGWLTAPLRWPVIRWVADKAYLYFARNRYRISQALTGQARCERCSLD
ncbi:thiol-disulfide oxidoreductase DCC family protein [Aliidiomarina sanyensis]|uniref:DUF393 domain-containing protein n=1 Tax=Aliidiomarina sanyensis TaxID=1249555 RepID=A0A432WPV3_9GAMM|nr:DUF393 domain-containing protein [Aliidiomarina sanyensis]RUO35814.1 DUF393 domain-containing protein [Aliidiomarina sanyensis]